MIGAERVDIREYPGEALAAGMVGRPPRATTASSSDSRASRRSSTTSSSGEDGRQTFDRAQDNTVIPGTLRGVSAPRDGDTIRLTSTRTCSGTCRRRCSPPRTPRSAQAASAVVLDAATTNPRDGRQHAGGGGRRRRARTRGGPRQPGDHLAVRAGSVQKIITAAAAIRAGLTDPHEVHSVDGSITMDGVTVSDAWQHGPTPYTTTGIFGKSSNVGTLMLAAPRGQESFSDYLERFGLGQRTGVELAGESDGLVPDLQNWRGGSFANLPVGQGLSMTTLQVMAGVYQTIANDGVRVPADHRRPRGSGRQPTRPSGRRSPARGERGDRPDGPRHVPRRHPVRTRSAGAIAGYQISGKTGTAQQIDRGAPATPTPRYWITFAGITRSDPRYVIAIMLDAPSAGCSVRPPRRSSATSPRG